MGEILDDDGCISIGESRQWFIKPSSLTQPEISEDAHMNADAQKVHKLTVERLNEVGLDIETVLEEFTDFVGESMLITHGWHGSHGDVVAVNNELKRCNKTALKNPVWNSCRLPDGCTVAEALKWREFDGRRTRKLKYMTLKHMCERLGVTFEQQSQHTAEGDARALAECFARLCQHKDYKKALQL